MSTSCNGTCPAQRHEVPLQVPTIEADSSTPPDGRQDDEALFGPGFVEAMIALEQSETLRYTGERWVYTRGDYPAQDVSLRDAEGERFAVLNAADDYRTLEELSSTTAPQRVHSGAIYLHQGESYLVTEYNGEMRHAIVKPVRRTTTPSPGSSTTCASSAPFSTDRRRPLLLTWGACGSGGRWSATGAFSSSPKRCLARRRWRCRPWSMRRSRSGGICR